MMSVTLLDEAHLLSPVGSGRAYFFIALRQVGAHGRFQHSDALASEERQLVVRTSLGSGLSTVFDCMLSTPKGIIDHCQFAILTVAPETWPDRAARTLIALFPEMLLATE